PRRLRRRVARALGERILGHLSLPARLPPQLDHPLQSAVVQPAAAELLQRRQLPDRGEGAGGADKIGACRGIKRDRGISPSAGYAERYHASVRRRPSANETRGSYPRSRRARLISAWEKRTSPARGGACTGWGLLPSSSLRWRTRSSTVVLWPLPML